MPMILRALNTCSGANLPYGDSELVFMNHRILYIANARMPTEKAHGIQIMKMCEALAHAGADIELAVPRRRNPIHTDAFEYYDVDTVFKITTLPAMNPVFGGRFGFRLAALTFAISAAVYSARNKAEIVYSRDELPLFFAQVFGKTIAWEAHVARWNSIVRRVAHTARRVITITRNLKLFFEDKGVPAGRLCVAPDGVDIAQFDIDMRPAEARRMLGLPEDKTIVMYTGHLYEWKGVDILARAAELLPEDVVVVFVGGTRDDVVRFRDRYSGADNIVVLGQKPYAEMPYYQKAADVLVLPNSAKNELSARYTSPMKLFEYMASGRPIVASNLSSLREVIDEESAVLVEPDSPKTLAEGIQKVLNDPAYGIRLAENARRQVEYYTWQHRAKTILSYIQYEAN